jgi:hypothetical protein
MSDRIPNEIIPVAYEISKRFMSEQFSLTDAINEFSENGRINKNSGRDYFYAFCALMNGVKFTRTLNVYSMNYFLDNILKDYGRVQQKALESLKIHIKYFEDSHGTIV